MDPTASIPPGTGGDDQEWARLMARSQDGDGSAYRRLLCEITPYLRSVARRHHRDSRDVEDSVQDILLTVHTIRHTYDPRRPFKPWLVAIARRRVIDRLRSQGRTRRRETELLDAHETFPAAETNPYEAESDGKMLRKAIESLPPGQRQAVTLVKIKEMSLKDAAAASGMSIASLKVSTHRALNNLRKILAGKNDES